MAYVVSCTLAAALRARIKTNGEPSNQPQKYLAEGFVIQEGGAKEVFTAWTVFSKALSESVSMVPLLPVFLVQIGVFVVLVVQNTQAKEI